MQVVAVVELTLQEVLAQVVKVVVVTEELEQAIQAIHQALKTQAVALVV